jgi:small subunit ribosomal protein S13e
VIVKRKKNLFFFFYFFFFFFFFLFFFLFLRFCFGFTLAGYSSVSCLGKGISGSSKPYKRAPPSWVKTSSKSVQDQVVRLARKGNTPSTIGAILRDGSGIPSVQAVTAKKITRILKAKGLQASLPEDLYYLIKKAVGMRKHLEKNPKDKDQKFRLVLVESRIYRKARYFKATGRLPATWRYEAANAAALLQ